MRRTLFLLCLLGSSAWAAEETPEGTEPFWRLLRRDSQPILQIWQRRSSVIRLQQSDPMSERLLRDLAAGSETPNDRAAGAAP
jgi:hypothetical protein